VKFIALGDESHLSLGGELRERFEDLRNSDHDLSDGALLQRALVHGDPHVTSIFRLPAPSYGRRGREGS
jgi:hypothetical protein